MDGGLFANNPAMCAFAEAERDRFGSDILLVSLGTGEATRPLPYEQAKAMPHTDHIHVEWGTQGRMVGSFPGFEDKLRAVFATHTDSWQKGVCVP